MCVVTSVLLPGTCYRMVIGIIGFSFLGLLELSWADLCQQANHWVSLLWACWVCPGPTFANKQIIGFHGSGPLRAYLGPTFANEQIIGFHCSGPTRAYLGPTFINEQIIGFHCFGPTRAYLETAFANQPILLKNVVSNLILCKTTKNPSFAILLFGEYTYIYIYISQTEA